MSRNGWLAAGLGVYCLGSLALFVALPAGGWVDAAQVIDRQVHATVGAGRDHPIGLCQIERQRFLAQHMHAVRGRRLGRGGMLGRLGGDHHEVEGLAIE